MGFTLLSNGFFKWFWMVLQTFFLVLLDDFLDGFSFMKMFFEWFETSPVFFSGDEKGGTPLPRCGYFVNFKA